MSDLPEKFRNTLTIGDSISGLREIPDGSIHMILSDIPYGIGAEAWDVLHDNANSAYLGVSPAQERAGSVFRSRRKPLNGWSAADRLIPLQYQEWCAEWAVEWRRVLKPGGSAVLFAGRRLAHRAVTALEDAGFTFKDMIAWKKSSAPFRAQRISAVYERRGDTTSAGFWKGWRVGNLRPTFEPILWLVKPYTIGGTIADNMADHGVGAFNEAAYTIYAGGPDNIIDIGFERGEAGRHPTQKPVGLMEALISLTTSRGHVVLDPFAGSGSSLIAAKRLDRIYVGYEANPIYAATAYGRLTEEPERLPV